MYVQESERLGPRKLLFVERVSLENILRKN